MDTKSLNDMTVDELLAYRRERLTERETAKTAVEDANTIIRARLEAELAQGRHQRPDGTFVQMVQQKPRREIIGEKLAELGVAINVIEAATVSKPVAPFLRVDYPTITEGDPTAQAATGSAEAERVQ